MQFRVGDLVAEDPSLYWNFSRSSYIFMTEEADPSEGDHRKVIGIVMSVHKRFPDAFFDIPYFVYKVKWLNAPNKYWDDKYFYADELELLSRVNFDEECDPEFEADLNFGEEEEEE